MEYKKTVLVPTDFSEVCLNAIHYGAQFAKLKNYSVSILHIIDNKSRAELKKEGKTYADVNKKLEKLAKDTTKKFGIEVSFLSREGSIFTDIGSVARDIKATILILGTHGKVGLQQRLTGSYAKKVITTSPCPVIVVHKKTDLKKGFKNIVFPISTTAEVRQKTKWAIMLADAFQSKIHLFQLYQPIEEERMHLQTIAKQITREFEKNNISCQLVEAKKNISFSKQVLSYANENKAELIAIMTSLNALDFIISAYDEKVIFNPYEIPVMCVNPVKTSTLHWF